MARTETGDPKEVRPRGIPKCFDRMRELVLQYGISDKDALPVRMVKEAVNLRKVTHGEVYDKFGHIEGYNLIYSLRHRNLINFKSVEKWAKILGMEVSMTLVKPNDRNK